MAEVNGLLGKGKGKIGNFFLKHYGDKTVVSAYPSYYTNAKSREQLLYRTTMANRITTYRRMRELLQGAFEKKGPMVSDYNRFVGVNSTTPIYLTKLMKERQWCIAAPYQITEGSLEPIAVEKIDGQQALKSSIQIGNLVMDENTTVGQFAQAVCANNSDFHDNEKLMFVQVLQKGAETAENITEDLSAVQPSIEVRYAVLELKPGSLVKVWDAVATDFETDRGAESGTDSGVGNGFENIDGCLGTNGLPLGCYAWVHFYKPSANEPTRLSTQTLVNLNETLVGQYSSEEAFLLAANSYGMKKDPFLAQGKSDTHKNEKSPFK